MVFVKPLNKDPDTLHFTHAEYTLRGSFGDKQILMLNLLNESLKQPTGDLVFPLKLLHLKNEY